MPSVPDIKLTRTDTTHDFSQKAEKQYSRQNYTSLTFSSKQRCPLIFLKRFISVEDCVTGSDEAMF